MNKRILGSLLTALLLSGVGAYNVSATPEVLTFEGLGNVESVNDFYNGGTGGSGSTGGPNFGISFTSDSLAIQSIASGGSGNFSNNPSGKTIIFFLTGAGDTMNVAGGFDTGFSFYYAAAQAGSVAVYSGLNGTGTLLATLSLSQTASPFSTWATAGVSFAGTAESAIFSGSANTIGFDDITLGSSTAGGSSVPDGGSTVVLLGMAVSALGLLKLKFA